MFPHYSMVIIDEDSLFGIFRIRSASDSQDGEAPRLFVTSHSEEHGRLVKNALNHCCELSSSLQEDSGAWTISDDKLCGKGLKYTFNIREINDNFNIFIYRMVDENTESAYQVAFARTEDDAEFVTGSLNHFCKHESNRKLYDYWVIEYPPSLQ